MHNLRKITAGVTIIAFIFTQSGLGAGVAYAAAGKQQNLRKVAVSQAAGDGSAKAIGDALRSIAAGTGINVAEVEAHAIGKEDVRQAMVKWFNPRSGRSDEIELENFLVKNGEEAIRIFVDLIEKDRGQSIGPWYIPDFSGRLPQAGLQSISIRKDAQDRSIVYEVPQDTKSYVEQERLRIMAKVAIQRALGRRIVVDFGIGFVGVAELAVGASSKRQIANPVAGNRFRGTITGEEYPTFMIGKDLLDGSALCKIEDIKQGYSPIRADDPELEPTLMGAHNRGNLSATFLDEVVAVADTVLLSIPQHPYKIMPEHPEMIKADPSAGLRVIQSVARHLPPGASCLVESTVYPLYIELFATPVFEEALQKRGLPREQWPSLVYSFQRLEPGINWLSSNREQVRMGGATTEKGAQALRAYFESIGYKYSIVMQIASVEYTKDSENAIRYQVIATTAPIQAMLEALGLDIYAMAPKIAAETPDKTQGAVLIQANLFPGGYCVPEQLGHLIYGLTATGLASELDIMQTYYPALANIVSLRMRPEFLGNWIVAELAAKGIISDEAKVCVMGITYNPQIDDARNGQSEILVRTLADFGVTNITAIDPYAANWPQLLLQQRYSPECEAAQGRVNQEWLKGIRYISDKDPYKALTAAQSVVVLATDHPQFIGKNKPAEKRTDGKGNVWPGIDAVIMTARMLSGDGKIIIDTHNFLSDEDIKEFLALGWDVRVLGRGNIDELTKEVTSDFQQEVFARLVSELERMAAEASAAGAGIGAALKLARSRQQQAHTGQVVSFGSVDAESARQEEAIKHAIKTQSDPRTVQMSARYEELGPLTGALADQFDAGRCVSAGNYHEMLTYLQKLGYLRNRLQRAISDSLLVAKEVLDYQALAVLSINKEIAELLKTPKVGPHKKYTGNTQDMVRDALIAQLEGANAGFQDGSIAIGTNFYPISGVIASSRPRTHGALNLQPGIGADPDSLKAAQALRAQLAASGKMTPLEARAELFGYDANLEKLEQRPEAVVHIILAELAGLGIQMKNAKALLSYSSGQSAAPDSLIKHFKEYGCVNTSVTDRPLQETVTPETKLIVLADKSAKDINPVEIVAASRASDGVLVFDADNVLTDEQIREFLALGWRVAGIGKGHIYGRDVKDIKGNTRHLAGLDDMITSEYKSKVSGRLQAAMDRMPETHTAVPPSTRNVAAAMNRAQNDVVRTLEIDIAGKCRLLSSLSSSLNLALDANKVKQPTDPRQLLARLKGLSYMNYTLDAAVVDLGRAAVELLNEDGRKTFNNDLDRRRRQERGERLTLPDPMNPAKIETLRHASIPDGMVKSTKKRILEETGEELSDEAVRERLQDLFYRRFTESGDIKVMPAVFIGRGYDGKHLQVQVDPDGNLPYYSARFIMDVAQGKHSISDEWVKYTVMVPLYIVDCTAENVDESARRTSNYFITELLMNSSLSQETRNWLIYEVLEKRKILTTIKAEGSQAQSKVAILAPVNPYADVGSKTGIGASGRAGVLVSMESGRPEVVVTKDRFGREQLIEIKGVGPLLGNRSSEEVTGMSRQIAGGVKRDASGKAIIGQTTMSQVHGLVRGGDATMIEMLVDQPAHKENGTPSGVAAAVFYSFKFLPGQPLSQVWRTISSTRRLGHMPMGGEEDYDPAKISYEVGWNAAEMLAGLGSAPYVHIAAGMDNIREGYFTDEDSLVDVANERDPRAAFNYYFDWTMRFVLHGYNEAKSGEIGTMHFEYFPHFIDGFLQHLFELPIARDNPQVRERLMKYHSTRHQGPYNIEEFMDDVYDSYVAYRVFRTRLENGYNPALDSAYTSNVGKKFRTQGAAVVDEDDNVTRLSAYQEALEFLTTEKGLLNRAEHAMTEGGYEARNFDFAFARQVIAEKQAQAEKLNQEESESGAKRSLPEGDEVDFKDIYRLGYYRARRQFVHGTVDVQSTSQRVASVLTSQTGALDKAAMRAALATTQTTAARSRATGEDEADEFLNADRAPATGIPLSKDEKWQELIQQRYQDATIVVLGGTGFIGNAYLGHLLDQYGEAIAAVRALTTRDPEILKKNNAGYPTVDRLTPQRGNHLVLEDIRKLIKGARVIIDTAGLAWQHPGLGRQLDKGELMKEECLQNGMSCALLGAVMEGDQRLVWTSTSAIDVLKNLLTGAGNVQLGEEITSRAWRYIEIAEKIVNKEEFEDIESLIRFVSEDLKQHPLIVLSGELTKSGQPVDVEKYSYAYSKFLGQRILELIHYKLGKEIVVVKISDVYGPGQPLGLEVVNPQAPARRLQRFLASYEGIRNGQYRPWENGEHGFRLSDGSVQQVVFNDYPAPTYIDDVVKMLFRASVVKLPYGTVVLETSGSLVSNIEMAKLARDIVDAPMLIEIITEQRAMEAPSQDREGLDILEVSNLTPLAEGIRRHLSWWRKINNTVLKDAVLWLNEPSKVIASRYPDTDMNTITHDTEVFIVLSAGRGKGHGLLPKNITPIAGKPLARHTIDAARDAGMSHVITIVGYKQDDVMKALGDDIIYVQSVDPKGGTGFAAYEAFCVRQLLSEEPLMIISMGDKPGITKQVLSELSAEHLKGGKEAAITMLTAVYAWGRHKGKGRIVRGKDGKIIKIMEQKDIDAIIKSGGVDKDSGLTGEQLDALTEGNCPLYMGRANQIRKYQERLINKNAQGEYYLTDIIEAMVKDGEDVRALTVTPEHPDYDLLVLDVTRPGDKEQVERVFTERSRAASAGAEAMTGGSVAVTATAGAMGGEEFNSFVEDNWKSVFSEFKNAVEVREETKTTTITMGRIFLPDASRNFGAFATLDGLRQKSVLMVSTQQEKEFLEAKYNIYAIVVSDGVVTDEIVSEAVDYLWRWGDSGISDIRCYRTVDDFMPGGRLSYTYRFTIETLDKNNLALAGEVLGVNIKNIDKAKNAMELWMAV